MQNKVGSLLFLIAGFQVSNSFLQTGINQGILRSGAIALCRHSIIRIQGIGNNDATEADDESVSGAESKRLFENVAGIEFETNRRSEQKTKRQGEATETLKREFSNFQSDASKAGFLKGATNPLRLSKQNDLGRLLKQANQALSPGQTPSSEEVPTDVESAVQQVTDYS